MKENINEETIIDNTELETEEKVDNAEKDTEESKDVSTDDNSQEENQDKNEGDTTIEDKPVSILSSLDVDKSISYKKDIKMDTVLVVSFMYNFNKVNNNTLQYIIYNEKLFNEHYGEIKAIAQELQETIKKDLESNGFNPLIL